MVRAPRMLTRYPDRLPFSRLIGARYGLDQSERALQDVAALRVTKAVINASLRERARRG